MFKKTADLAEVGSPKGALESQICCGRQVRKVGYGEVEEVMSEFNIA